MPLHPEIAAGIAAEAKLGLPPLASLPVSQARTRVALRERPKGPPVFLVEMTRIPVADGAITARIYRPAADGPLPAIVFVHGGGWVVCSLDTHDNICRHLCVDTGALVISIDYRMAPEHPFPVPQDDCVAALRFVFARAHELGIDRDRVVVGGDSAGGNLALATVIRLRDADGPAPAGQFLLYPVTEHYSAGFPSYREFASGFGLTADEMKWYWNLYAPTPDLYLHPLASPLRADLSALPPSYVMTAECDVLRDEGEALAAKLDEAGVPVTFGRFDGLNHGCANAFGTLSCVEPFRKHLLGWLAAVLARR